MKEEGFSRDKISFISQLIKALEESETKLEEYYKVKDHRNFNNTKNFMLTILGKISEVIK